MIAKKPRLVKEAKEKKADKFIRDGAATPDKNGGRANLDLVPCLINFDRALLDRIDAMAKEMGLNRTAFVVSSCAEKLRNLERTN